MADYHHVYASREEEETEWDAIQRRLGNLPPRPKKKPPPKFRPQQEEVLDEAALERRGEEALEELEDDLEDDRFLEAYRQKRLAELAQRRQIQQEFGSLTEVGEGAFVREVTEASVHSWVVVLLYAPRHLKSEEMEKSLGELAADFPSTKFVKILSEKCIPGYPRQNLPTLLVYRDQSCKKNLVGTEPYRQGRLHAEGIAETLNGIGPICQ